MRPRARSTALLLTLARGALASSAWADPPTMAVDPGSPLAVDCSAVRFHQTPYLGGPLPPCARLTREADVGLTLAATFAWDGAWGSSIVAGIGSLATENPGRLPWLLIPVVGPVLAMQASQPAWENALLVADATVQIAGLMLFAAAEARSHPTLVYGPSRRLAELPRVRPLVGPTLVGASLAF